MHGLWQFFFLNNNLELYDYFTMIIFINKLIIFIGRTQALLYAFITKDKYRLYNYIIQNPGSNFFCMAMFAMQVVNWYTFLNILKMIFLELHLIFDTVKEF